MEQIPGIINYRLPYYPAFVGTPISLSIYPDKLYIPKEIIIGTIALIVEVLLN
jgi:hypothetical protein